MRMTAPLLLALAMLLGPHPGDEAKGSSRTNSPGSDELFSQPKVLSLKIEIPSGNLGPLRKEPRVYVKGTVREGTTVYPAVGIRLKGNASFEAQEKKPSLALKFNEFSSLRLFHGQGKIFLDNAHQDSTFLSEALGSEVFRAAGVPAARVTFARVELNGRDLGLYVVEQAVNRDFLSEFFDKSKGNLYEGSHTDVADELARASGDTDDDRPDLKKLASASREADPAQRLEKLAGVLDLDRFISFVAAEVLLWHRNGYAMGLNNYRIYHDPSSDRMVFIPHGLDLLFNKPTGALLPEWKGLVAKAVLETPEGQRRFRDRLAALLEGPCKVETLQARLNDLAAKIRPVFSQDAAEARRFDTAVVLMHERIAQRAYFIAGELKKRR